MQPLLDDPVFREVLDSVGTARNGRNQLEKMKGYWVQLQPGDL